MFSRNLCKKVGDVAIGVLVTAIILSIIIWIGEIGFLLYKKEFQNAFLVFVVPPVILTAIIGAGQNIEP